MTSLKKFLSSMAALSLLFSAQCGWANDDIATLISKSMQGAKVISVHMEPIPQQTSMLIVVVTTNGVKKFIVAPGKIESALLALNTPAINNAVMMNQPYIGANNQGNIALARRQPGIEPPPIPVRTSIAPINAPAMISRTALSANQLASK
jgi:hypothetical protein